MTRLLLGDCLEKLKELPDNSVDSVVTDPPYGLAFMGKKWDYDIPSVEIWKECLRVLKPGGHLLSFAGTRTQHRMAIRIEDAGFEIRDMIAWVHGQGFPKSTRINANPKFCQCALTVRNAENTNLSQPQGDHNNKVLVGHDDDHAPSSADHLMSEDISFQGDCRQDCDLSDAQLPGILSHGQEPSPLQGCVQEHNRSSLPDDVGASVPLHNLSSVQCSDRLSNLDYSRHDLSVNAKLKNNPKNNIPVEVSEHLSDKQDKFSSATSSSHYTIAFPFCQVCGKPNADGYGTSLKPALEPITVARKPLEGTIAANCLKWGVGGINVDGCRVETSDKYSYPNSAGGNGFHGGVGREPDGSRTDATESNPLGRFPANFIHDGSDEVVGLFPSPRPAHTQTRKSTDDKEGQIWNLKRKSGIKQSFGDSGSAARFFYCAKAGKKERNGGCEGLGGNKHCTVKPLALMCYLVRLVTPKGGVVLDPFMGSGTTGIACKREGMDFIGIEREAEYMTIAEARIGNTEKTTTPSLFDA